MANPSATTMATNESDDTTKGYLGRKRRWIFRVVLVFVPSFALSSSMFVRQWQSNVIPLQNSTNFLPETAKHKVPNERERTSNVVELESSSLVGKNTTMSIVAQTAAPASSAALPSKEATATNSTNSGASMFAYAFVIGGCNPDYKPSYQNYLFNIAVATRILRHCGARADVVALFQISQNAKTTVLPYEDLRILHAIGVRVLMIPPQLEGVESFYRTQLDKFRILGLTQYQRILFMDGDVIPLTNLDYLMELSYAGSLRENVVIQGIFEPANGGFFMLTPGYLPELQEIVTKREQSGKNMSHPFFDPVLGWGHALEEDDQWVAIRSSGRNWTFLAAFADQGLLYHYTKYARRDVSIVLRNGTVENWATSSNSSTVQRQQVLDKPFHGIDAGTHIQIPGKHSRFGRPIRSHLHFTGRGKPWMSGVPVNYTSEELSKQNGKRYWFYQLHCLNQELELGLNFTTHWSGKKQRPSLGLYPVYKQAVEASTNLLTPLREVVPDKEVPLLPWAVRP